MAEPDLPAQSKRIVDAICQRIQAATAHRLYDEIDHPRHGALSRCLELPVSADDYLRALFFPTVDDMPMYAAACAAIDDQEPHDSPVRRMQIAFLSMMQLQHLQSWDLVAAFLQQGGGEALLSNFMSAEQPSAAPIALQARALSVELVLAMTAHPEVDWFAPPSTGTLAACHAALRAWAAAPPGVIQACFALQHSSTPGEPLAGLQVLAFWLSWARAACTAGQALHLSASMLDALAAWAVAGAHAAPASAAAPAADAGAVPDSESGLAAMLYNDFVRWVPSDSVASGSAALGATRPAAEVERLVQQLAQRCAARQPGSSAAPARIATAALQDASISLDPLPSCEYAADAGTLPEAHRLASLYKRMGDRYYRQAQPAEAATAYAACMSLAAHIARYRDVCTAVRQAVSGTATPAAGPPAWQRFLGVRLAVLRVSAASNLVAIAQQEPRGHTAVCGSAHVRAIACACTALQLGLTLVGQPGPPAPVRLFTSAAWIAALQAGAGCPRTAPDATWAAEDGLPALVQSLATEGQAWLQAAGPAVPSEVATLSLALADMSETLHRCRPAKLRFLCLKTLVRLADAWREAKHVAVALALLRAAACLSQEVPDQPCGPALPWVGMQLGIAKRVSAVEAELAAVQALAAPGSGLQAELAAALSLRAEFGGEPETEADALAREEAAFAAEHDERQANGPSTLAARPASPASAGSKSASTASVSSSRVAAAAASPGPASLAAIQQAAGRRQSKPGAKSSASTKRAAKKSQDKFANLRSLL